MSYFQLAQLRQRGGKKGLFSAFQQVGAVPFPALLAGWLPSQANDLRHHRRVYELDKEITSCPPRSLRVLPAVAGSQPIPLPGDIIADACTRMWKYIKLHLGARLLKSNPQPHPSAPRDDRPLRREIKPSRKRDFKKWLLGRRKAEGNKQTQRKHVFPSVMQFLWKPLKHAHTVWSLGAPGAFFLAKKAAKES